MGWPMIRLRGAKFWEPLPVWARRGELLERLALSGEKKRSRRLSRMPPWKRPPREARKPPVAYHNYALASELARGEDGGQTLSQREPYER